MDCKDISAINIEEGKVKKIMSGNNVLWRLPITYNFTVEVSNSVGTFSKDLSITVK